MGNKTVHAESKTTLNTIPVNTSLLGGHFIYYAGNGGQTAASANVIQNLNDNPALWGYNTHIGANGLQLRDGEIPYAILNANGLITSKGGIRAGTARSDNFVYLSSDPFPDNAEGLYKHTADNTVNPEKTYYTYDSEHDTYNIVENPIDEEITIYYEAVAAGTIALDNYTAIDWREIIGTKFGVRADGTLYAANANIDGDIVAQSLTISGTDRNYNGIAALNITGYQIEIRKNLNHSSIVDSDTQVYIYPIMYHNGSVVSITDYTKYIWYKNNASIGITGSAVDGGILADYGFTYRVEYDFSDAEVDEGQEIQIREVDPAKYITQIGPNGITIHPEYQDNTTIIQLDGTGLDIKKNTISVAKYGETARIGRDNNSRFLMNVDSLQAYDSNNNLYFNVNANGITYGNNIEVANINYVDDQFDDAAKTATNYLSNITGGGVYVHASETSSDPSAATAKGVKITDQIDIIRQGSSILAIGETNVDTQNEVVRIGKMNETRAEIDFHSLRLTDKEGREYFHVSDLRNKDGSIIETYVAEGRYLDYIQPPYYIDDVVYIKFNDTLLEKNVDYTFESRWVEFITKPTQGDLIEFKYIPEEQQITKAYTIGIRKNGYIGAFSTSIGYNNIASGFYSYAEGHETAAFGDYSHVEGRETKVDGGSRVLAIDGNTGRFAHAEGYQTYTRGNYSHVQNLGTTATKSSVTALGRYNDDLDKNGEISLHALYLGNGESEDVRSNALVVDWEGNVAIEGELIQSSDRRLKDHQSYLSKDAIRFIQSLKPAYFFKNEQPHVGFYAQDVELADPWNCMVGKMNGFKTLGYTEIIAPLVTYCQHLEERIKELEAKK